MQTPKISVIVPVYKVEPYLRKCLDSIVNQTYRNLEIILVDDGSPDRCGEICDEYAGKDERIQVVHQENQGLSAVRNIGLKLATGEWIGWVDSDDWIELDMFEYMLKNAIEQETDIAVCSHIQEFPEHSVFHGYLEMQILNREEALELLLKNDLMQNYVCDKLFRKRLFDGIYFPKGRTFEDIAVTHRTFIRARRIVCLPEAKYHYLQRTDSIVSDFSLGNQINHYIGAKERLDEMKNDWPQFVPLLEAQCVASASSIWMSYYTSPPIEQKKYGKTIKQIALFSKMHYKSALQQMHLGRAGRIAVRLTPYANPIAFALAYVGRCLYRLKNSNKIL